METGQERPDVPSTDEITPTYPPTYIVILVPLEGEPKVVETGGLATYLLEAILLRCAQQHATVWELEPDRTEE